MWSSAHAYANVFCLENRHKSSAHSDRHKSSAHSDRHKSSAHSDRHKSSAHSDHHKSSAHSDRHKSSAHSDRHKSSAHSDRHKSSAHSLPRRMDHLVILAGAGKETLRFAFGQCLQGPHRYSFLSLSHSLCVLTGAAACKGVAISS